MRNSTKSKAAARATLNIRIRAETRNLIDRAAAARGTNRTDFILDAARRAAEETLLERALIQVDAKAYAAFVERLDAPGRPSAALRQTMQAPAPWKPD